MKNYSNTSRKGSKGFTLVELLVVITIIVTLMAILIPVVGSVQRNAIKTKAKNSLTSLVTSVDLYYNTYNVLPSNTRSAPSEDEEVETTEPIMSILAGINLDGLNKKEQIFFTGDVAKGKTRASAYNGLRLDSTSAELYSPWKMKGKLAGGIRGYILLLDYGYDEKLDNPFDDGQVIPRRAIAWSAGKDGRFTRGLNPKADKNEDNVYSWF